MIKKLLSVLLCCLLFVSADASLLSAQTPTEQTDASLAKVKTAVRERGTGEKRRVKVKLLDGTTLKGHISQSDENSFTLVDAKTGQSRAISYREVAKVSNLSSKGDKIAIWIIAGAGAVTAVVLLGILKARCNNEGGC